MIPDHSAKGLTLWRCQHCPVIIPTRAVLVTPISLKEHEAKHGSEAQSV